MGLFLSTDSHVGLALCPEGVSSTFFEVLEHSDRALMDTHCSVRASQTRSAQVRTLCFGCVDVKHTSLEIGLVGLRDGSTSLVGSETAKSASNTTHRIENGDYLRSPTP